jgi:hypothetical protein
MTAGRAADQHQVDGVVTDESVERLIRPRTMTLRERARLVAVLAEHGDDLQTSRLGSASMGRADVAGANDADVHGFGTE